jgi:hypothetical protein
MAADDLDEVARHGYTIPRSGRRVQLLASIA